MDSREEKENRIEAGLKGKADGIQAVSARE